MTVLIYKNCWDGFLTAVFEAFRRKNNCEVVREDRDRNSSMFERTYMDIDEQRSERVRKGMDRLGDEVGAVVYQAWLSERSGIEDNIIRSLELGFEMNRDPFPMLAYQEVKRVVLAARIVGREAQRFLGLTRLKHVHEDLYAADFTHDCNLLPLMGDHFCGRFGDQRIVIRDIERRQALVTGNGEWEIVSLPEEKLTPLPPDGDFEKLWRRYFEVIANPARKNLKLQQKFVPLKYRMHLTEFQGIENELL